MCTKVCKRVQKLTFNYFYDNRLSLSAFVNCEAGTLNVLNVYTHFVKLLKKLLSNYLPS